MSHRDDETSRDLNRLLVPERPRTSSRVEPPSQHTRGLTATDVRALEHQRLARQLEQTHADVLRLKREKAEQGSTEDADYLFALSLAQAEEEPLSHHGTDSNAASPAFQEIAGSANGSATQSQSVPASSQSPLRGPGLRLSAASSNSDQNPPGKIRSIFKTLFGSKKPKKPEDIAALPSRASSGGLGVTVNGDTSLEMQGRVHSSPPLSPSAFSEFETPTMIPTSVFEENSSFHRRTIPVHGPGHGPGQLLTAASAPLATAAAVGSSRLGSNMGESQQVEGIVSSDEQAEIDAKYRDLMQTAPTLQAELQKTLADKVQTLDRLKSRGEELQSSIRGLERRINTAEGWESFSLLSQQQVDLDSRVRQGREQQKLIKSCIRQLQDMQAHVMTHQPHFQDVIALQDTTFAEVIRHLEQLDLKPAVGQLLSLQNRQHVDEVASSAAEDPVNDSGNDGDTSLAQQIDFASVIAAARQKRLAHEHAVLDVHTAASEAVLAAATLANHSDGGARAATPLRQDPLDEDTALEVEENTLMAQQAQLDAESRGASASSATPREPAVDQSVPWHASHLMGNTAAHASSQPWNSFVPVPPASPRLDRTHDRAYDRPYDRTYDNSLAAAAAAEAASSAAQAAAVASQWTPNTLPSNRSATAVSEPPVVNSATRLTPPEYRSRRKRQPVPSSHAVQGIPLSAANAAVEQASASLAAYSRVEYGKPQTIDTGKSDGGSGPVAILPTRIPYPPERPRHSTAPQRVLQPWRHTLSEDRLPASSEPMGSIEESSSGNMISRGVPAVPAAERQAAEETGSADDVVKAELVDPQTHSIERGMKSDTGTSPNGLEIQSPVRNSQSAHNGDASSISPFPASSGSQCQSPIESLAQNGDSSLMMPYESSDSATDSHDDSSQGSDSWSSDTELQNESSSSSQRSESTQCHPNPSHPSRNSSNKFDREYKPVRLHRAEEPHGDGQDFDLSDDDSTFHMERLRPLECITEETASVMADTPSSHRSTAHGSSNPGSGHPGSVLNTLHTDGAADSVSAPGSDRELDGAVGASEYFDCNGSFDKPDLASIDTSLPLKPGASPLPPPHTDELASPPAVLPPICEGGRRDWVAPSVAAPADANEGNAFSSSDNPTFEADPQRATDDSRSRPSRTVDESQDISGSDPSRGPQGQLSTSGLSQAAAHRDTCASMEDSGGLGTHEDVPLSDSSEALSLSPPSEAAHQSPLSDTVLQSPPSEAVPQSSSADAVLQLPLSEALPQSPPSETVPPSSLSEAVPPSSLSEAVPRSSLLEALLQSPPTEAVPSSSLSETVPPSSLSETVPPSSLSEAVPQSSPSEAALLPPRSEAVSQSSPSEAVSLSHLPENISLWSSTESVLPSPPSKPLPSKPLPLLQNGPALASQVSQQDSLSDSHSPIATASYAVSNATQRQDILLVADESFGAEQHSSNPPDTDAAFKYGSSLPTLEQELQTADAVLAALEHGNISDQAAVKSLEEPSAIAESLAEHPQLSIAAAMSQPEDAQQVEDSNFSDVVQPAGDAGTIATSPMNSSPLTDPRTEERLKRAERQSALDIQREDLAERRRLRRGFKEAGPRVRFALDESERVEAPISNAKGLLSSSYVPAASQRGKRPRTLQPSPVPHRRSNSIESIEVLASGKSPGHMRTSSGNNLLRPGIQERQYLSRRAADVRVQMRDPASVQRRSDVELQMQRMEIMSLLNDHRHAEHNAVAALDGSREELTRAGLQTAAQLRSSSRGKERTRHERERPRTSRASVSSLASDSASLESCSDASSLASSRSPLEMRSRSSSLSKRGASIPVMSGSAGLPTLTSPNGDSSNARTGRRVSGSPTSAGPIAESLDGFSSSAAAALSSDQTMTETEILAHYRALAAEIRLQDNVPLPAAASFLAEIRTATKNRPAAAALGAVNWPSRKIAALGECIEGWQEVQQITKSLQEWQSLPGFDSSDHCIRIETFLRIVKQTWGATGGSEIFLQKCNAAGVRWSPEIRAMLRRASLQIPKVYLEQVSAEVTENEMPQSDKLALLRDALVVTEMIEEFAGGLDRDSCIWRKRMQNMMSSLDKR